MMRAMERKYRPEKNRRKGIWCESGNTKDDSRGTGYSDGMPYAICGNGSCGLLSVVSSNLEESMVAYSNDELV